MSNADLRAAAEALRRQARHGRIKARLLRFEADLNGCPCCRARAAEDDGSAASLEAAANLVLQTIEVYEAAHRMVYGRPPQPERRHKLRLVGTD